uniref:MTCL family member 3a n=1 Tax=Poecilia reticulata TaxID=8081 RepID=A0A3P9PAM0_POERE
MDLRCRLDHNERDWLREKAELLERFDVERREWECQLKDMQKKIEEVRSSDSKLRNSRENAYLQNDCCRNARKMEKMFKADFQHVFVNIRGLFVKYLLLPNYKMLILSHCLSVCCVLLSQALKEIARVSEELCSYQDEIRKKSGDKRWISFCKHLDNQNLMRLTYQIYDDLRALQRENWITLSPESTWNRSSSDTWMANTSDPYRYGDAETSPGESSDMETAAPPIPPRTSSWNLNSSNPDTELHIPESPMATMRKCHSPCVLLDRKCNSPSIVRKFEAMLQENEGKVFKDGVPTSCSIPSNSNCNTGCCHNRWSCDASKLTHNKQLTYGTVQKSFSEVNILTAGKELCPQKNNDVGKVQVFPVIQEFPVDSISQGIQSVSPSLQGSRRNLMLERKTAEFNRTLFQAEMGRGVDAQETSFEACQPVFGTSSHILPPNDATSPSMCSDVSIDITDSYSKALPSPSISTSTKQNTESEPVASVSPLQPSAESKKRHVAQPRQRSDSPLQLDSSRPVPRIMNEHPWKPLTLAAYPRPEGSRSNYGAVEKILKNYESAARALQNEMVSNPTELDMLDMAPLPLSPTLRHIHTSPTAQEDEESSVTPPSVHKNFSRPARPANRRLPSRWASRSPTSSSSPSSSPFYEGF